MFRAPNQTSRAPACLLKLAATGFSIGSCEILSFAKTIEISCEVEFKKKGERTKIRGNTLF